MQGRLALESLTVKYAALYPALIETSETSPNIRTVTDSSDRFASAMAAETLKAVEAEFSPLSYMLFCETVGETPVVG